MSKLSEALRKVRESELYLELKSKYDNLDNDQKSYIQLGSVAGIALVIAMSILGGMAKLAAMKSEINEREELIGYLSRSSDQITQLKMQAANGAGEDIGSNLASFVDSVITSTGIDRTKVSVGSERVGDQDKETQEVLADIKISRVNLKVINRFLFALIDRGAARGLNISNLVIDTKGDSAGYLDAEVTVSQTKSKLLGT